MLSIQLRKEEEFRNPYAPTYFARLWNIDDETELESQNSDSLEGLAGKVGRELFENALGRDEKRDRIYTIESSEMEKGRIKSPVTPEEIRHFALKLYG